MARFAWLLVLAINFSQASESQVFQFQQPHMGCLFTLKLVAEKESAAQAASKTVFSRIAKLDQIFSDYKADSEAMQLSASAGGEEARSLSPEMRLLLTSSQKWWEWSGGNFDVTMGACTQLWRQSSRSRGLPDPRILAGAISSTGFAQLNFNPQAGTVKIEKSGLRLDFGAIAKGYAVDESVKILTGDYHLKNFLIDAAGQVAAIGHPPNRGTWSVAIEPLQPSSDNVPPVALRLKNLHLATSGGLHQHVEIKGRQYAHIIDPRTGLGLTHRVQASAVATDGTTADAVATALCLMSEASARQKLRELPGVEAQVGRIIDEGKLEVWETSGWSSLADQESTGK